MVINFYPNMVLWLYGSGWGCGGKHHELLNVMKRKMAITQVKIHIYVINVLMKTSLVSR